MVKAEGLSKVPQTISEGSEILSADKAQDVGGILGGGRATVYGRQ